MKRRRIITILLLLLLAACKEKNLLDQAETKKDDYVDRVPSGDEEKIIGQADPDKEGYESILGYDDNRSDRKNYAFDGTALYVTQSLSRKTPLVFVLDLETGEPYVLCSKPDCPHDSQECNAYTKGFHLSLSQDELILNDFEKITSMRLDGSGGEEIGRFVTSMGLGDGMYSRPAMVHRGHVYLGYSIYRLKESILRFERLPVSGGEPEILWEQTCPATTTSEEASFYNYFGIGGKVYFANHYDGTEKIYCYCIKTGEVSKIYEGTFSMDYPAEDGKWYFQKNDGVYRWDPESGEERRLLDYANSPIDETGAGRYLYFYKDGFVMQKEGDMCTFIFYDWEGKAVAEKRLDVPRPDLLFGEGHFGEYFVCTY